MNIIKLAIERPVAVLAAVIMVIVFGLMSLILIPIQLIPDIRKPVISISTVWAGAAPIEIEREIVNRQEEVLKGLRKLEKIVSTSQNGRARIRLEFQVGSNMDKIFLLVANRLDRVEGYPPEAKQPTIKTSGSEDNPITWLMLEGTTTKKREIHTFGDIAEDIVKDRLERIQGVSAVNVYGAAKRQMEIITNPNLLATHKLTISDIAEKLRLASSSISAGEINEGKRRYVLRTEGELKTTEDVSSVILRSNNDLASGRLTRISVGDIAKVRFNYKKPTSRIRFNGKPAIAINAVRETGANVIKVMDKIKKVVRSLNRGPLQEFGLSITKVYDETVYIKSSIHLVQQNIIFGGTLAVIVLFLFLRSGRAALIISLAIPVSIIGAFVAMAGLGRSLNVISLAGIAFAVGMVVDSAIVVLENIFRLRESGKSQYEAAHTGTSHVWPAILVSAVTTVVVFIPILTMELEVGQLFRDIAVALSVSVVLSLLVAVTVIPALSKRLLTSIKSGSETKRGIPFIDKFSSRFVEIIIRLTNSIVASKFLSLAVVVIICAGGVLSTWLLLPKLEYLPEGNRNLVFGILAPPPGYNLKTTEQIAGKFEQAIYPLLVQGTKPFVEEIEKPLIKRFFFVASRGNTFLGAQALDPNRVDELVPILKKAAFQEPGTFGLISKRSLFGRGFGGQRVIEVNISGIELEPILEYALEITQQIKALPIGKGIQIRPKPGLELGAPEVRLIPNRVKLADNGISTKEFGNSIDAFNDGLLISQITSGSRRLDLIIRGPLNSIDHTQGIDFLPVVTSEGRIVPANVLADVKITSGPTQIRHIERERTVTLQIRPPNKIPLETAIQALEKAIFTENNRKEFPGVMSVSLSGAADKLTQTWNAMIIDMILALIIVYLVMAVLFESFMYPLIIMLSVPLATAGGVLGLSIMNQFHFQPLDMLTLLGFVILIGIVVNNAILLVHQTLFHFRNENMEVPEAIIKATRNRIRPIFMSTLTSVFGMLPLVLFAGPGSELYRGLGSVIVGGLSLSAILTLLLIPSLMNLFTSLIEAPHSTNKSEII